MKTATYIHLHLGHEQATTAQLAQIRTLVEALGVKGLMSALLHTMEQADDELTAEALAENSQTAQQAKDAAMHMTEKVYGIIQELVKDTDFSQNSSDV